MLNDCRNSNLDLIVCKSISRFGWNTEEILKTIREIKQYGVNVYFQLENMNTSDSTSEHVMTVISAFREEENRSRRENVRRGIIQKAETGTSKYYTKPCYGYRRGDNGELAIYEPEAANIRLYLMFTFRAQRSVNCFNLWKPGIYHHRQGRTSGAVAALIHSWTTPASRI